MIWCSSQSVYNPFHCFSAQLKAFLFSSKTYSLPYWGFICRMTIALWFSNFFFHNIMYPVWGWLFTPADIEERVFHCVYQIFILKIGSGCDEGSTPHRKNIGKWMRNRDGHREKKPTWSEDIRWLLLKKIQYFPQKKIR